MAVPPGPSDLWPTEFLPTEFGRLPSPQLSGRGGLSGSQKEGLRLRRPFLPRAGRFAEEFSPVSASPLLHQRSESLRGEASGLPKTHAQGRSGVAEEPEPYTHMIGPWDQSHTVESGRKSRIGQEPIKGASMGLCGHTRGV